MADRTCAKCGKQFSVPSQLRRHGQRKTPCAPVVPAAEAPAPGPAYGCCCGRRFSQEASLRRHQRESCRAVPPPAPPQPFTAAAGAAEQALAALQLEMAEMRSLLAQRPALLTQTAHQITNITINLFGQEDLGHITPEQIRQVLDRNIRRGPESTFVETAMLIYSDPKHPENTTAYMANSRLNTVMVNAGLGWELVPLSTAAPPMAQRTIDLLHSRQPLEDGQYKLAEYGNLLRPLFEAKGGYADGRPLWAVLVRNKRLCRGSPAPADN